MGQRRVEAARMKGALAAVAADEFTALITDLAVVVVVSAITGRRAITVVPFAPRGAQQRTLRLLVVGVCANTVR